MPKTIIFGDVHGCLDEWQALIKKIKPGPQDQLISVGDLVCKGPDSKGVLDFAMTLPNFKCIKGNHEEHLVRFWKTGNLPGLIKEYQQRALKEFGDQLDYYMKYMDSWPYYLDEPEFLVVHAGIRTGIPLEEQSTKEMTNLRMIDDKPWYSYYKEKKLIVHGHWAKQGLTVLDNVIGLDSGCVYGRELTAVVLPEREIVSVPAKKAYAPV